MSIDTNIVLSTLSTMSQISATILSIYLAILVFVLGYIWSKKDSRKKTSAQIEKISIYMIGICIILAIVIFIFIFPSTEFWGLNYIVFFLMIVYNLWTVYGFATDKKYSILEGRVVMLSIIMGVISLIIGFFIIISTNTAMLSVDYLQDSYVFFLMKMQRFFIVSILISAIYLICFVLLHRNLISKN